MWSPSRYILTLLLDIPLLEELVLDQWVYRDSDLTLIGTPNPVVELTYLKILTLNFAFPVLLDGLILPNLRNFRLDPSGKLLPLSSIGALGRFLARTTSLEVAKLSSPFHILGFPATHFLRRLVLNLACDSPVTPAGSGVESLSYGCILAHFPYLEHLEVRCEEDGDEREGDLDGVVEIAKALVAICRARNSVDASVPETFLGEFSARFVVGTSPAVFEKLLDIQTEAKVFPRFTHFQVLKQ